MSGPEDSTRARSSNPSQGFLATDAIYVPGRRKAFTSQRCFRFSALPATLKAAKIYPNGAKAVLHLRCTQSTEIISTRCVMLSRALPQGCDFATMYTAAIRWIRFARMKHILLIDLLTAIERRELRHARDSWSRHKLQSTIELSLLNR
jgi:molybdate transport system substrate-binding protein